METLVFFDPCWPVCACCVVVYVTVGFTYMFDFPCPFPLILCYIVNHVGWFMCLPWTHLTVRFCLQRRLDHPVVLFDSQNNQQEPCYLL